MFNKINKTAVKQAIFASSAIIALVFGFVSFADAAIDTRLVGEPTCQIAFSQNYLHTGSHVTELHWDSQNATWATIDTIGTVDLHGARSMHMNRTRTYTMTVGNAQGKTTTCTALLRVAGDELTPSCSLSVSPSYINGTGRAELSWNTNDADYIAIDNTIGVVSDYKTGYIIVSPNKTTKYTMTVRDEETGETHYCSANLTVAGGTYQYGSATTGGYTGGQYYTGQTNTNGGYYGTTEYRTGGYAHRVRINTIPYTGASEVLYTLLLALMAGVSFYGAVQLRKMIG